MHLKIFAFVTIALIVPVTSEGGDGATCQPGQHKFNDCNFCFCTHQRFWACTRMFCGDPATKIRKCKNGMMRHEDCNHCRCVNGFWLCTQKECECTPGAVIRVDCNYCRCAADGKSKACTMMNCPEYNYRMANDVEFDPELDLQFDRRFCRPGDFQRINCNECYCTYSRSWACTRRTCSTRKRRGVPVAADLKNTPCAPNDYFTIDCNTCYCNIERTGYLCTENLCPIDGGVAPKLNETTTNATPVETTTNSTDLGR